MSKNDEHQKVLDNVALARKLMSLANELDKQQPQKKTRKVSYIGIFVDSNKLKSMVTPIYTPDKGGKLQAGHVTLQFKPTPEQQQAFEALVGQIVPITIHSVSYDDEIQAVSVQLPDGIECANRHPHITISHLADVSPAESKTLLARAEAGDDSVQTEEFNPPMTIMGIIDFFPRISTVVP